MGLLRAGASALAIQACLLAGAVGLYTACLSGPPSMGPGGGLGGAAWPMVGGQALPVVLFAGARAAGWRQGVGVAVQRCCWRSNA